jgi:transcriptional regulator with PAS, ATPase and Fis domain
LRRFAACDAPVLVVGETGTGKELFARALHTMSTRHAGPLVSVNCAQFQDGQLAVSELFGYRKGSFTGALADCTGHFRAAHRGVLFLDEIGELPGSVQAILLRAIGEGEIMPLGESRAVPVDVRIISATARPVRTGTNDGPIRRDLLYRIRTCEIQIPPLRNRGEDSVLLARHHLDRLNRRAVSSVRLSRDAERAIRHHRWPGNVRELLAAIESSFYSRHAERIEANDLPADVLTAECSAGPLRGTLAEATTGPVIDGPLDFWAHVHGPYLRRQISRSDVRMIVSQGLAAAGSSYRRFLQAGGVCSSQYFKAMDFLRHYDLKPPRTP